MKNNVPLQQTPNRAVYQALSTPTKEHVKRLVARFRLSFQQHSLLINMARDLQAWNQIQELENLSFRSYENKDSAAARRQIWQDLQAFYEKQQQHLPNYQQPAPPFPPPPNPERRLDNSQGKLLGRCPVASVKTRCCNLLTLDAVQRCGFGCSYCAVQHFYHDGAISFPAQFKQRLAEIELDAQRWYHIGTGQASDSLLWGNEQSMLSALCDFAIHWPRAIVEFKSKSARIEELLQLHKERGLPQNFLFTWSLAPQVAIEHEERLTASLDARLLAARRLADLGCKVGFHFHPIMRFRAWQRAYEKLALRLQKLFAVEEVVTLSLGTLTFAKSLLQQIRRSDYNSQILRMPLEETAGKFSYSYEVKKELLSQVYQSFKGWHEKVFFYMCMEDPQLWPEVFGYDYTSNEDFEENMLKNYREKIYTPEQLKQFMKEENCV